MGGKSCRNILDGKKCGRTTVLSGCGEFCTNCIEQNDKYYQLMLDKLGIEWDEHHSHEHWKVVLAEQKQQLGQDYTPIWDEVISHPDFKIMGSQVITKDKIAKRRQIGQKAFQRNKQAHPDEYQEKLARKRRYKRENPEKVKEGRERLKAKKARQAEPFLNGYTKGARYSSLSLAL